MYQNRKKLNLLEKIKWKGKKKFTPKNHIATVDCLGVCDLSVNVYDDDDARASGEMHFQMEVKRMVVVDFS